MRVGVVALLVVAGCTADAAEPATAPDRPIAGPQGAVGQFVVECGFSHHGADDPIVHPGHEGASHLHAFFGSEATDAESSYDELVAAPTTCANARDTAAYWAPALLVDGEPIEPVGAIAYYRAGLGVEPASVVPYPPGLKMIAGDAEATEPQPASVAAWSCGSGARREAEPPDCPARTTLRMVLTFPDCWDGRNVDTADHRAHMAYSSGGQCPGDHAVAIPQLQLAVDYPAVDPARLSLVSGPLVSAHADFWNTWDQAALQREVTRCLHRDVVCGVSD